MLTLDAMRTDASNRRQQLTQFPAAPNPPTWSSFTASVSGFQVVLIPPTVDGTNPYLAQGIGLDFPATNQNQQNQSTASINNPTFLYQVQLATDAGFTQNVTTYDMGTSTTITIPASGNQFAQARAKFVNSPFSNWKPFGSGSAVSGATYRPFEYVVTVGGTGAVANPFQGMDGNNATFAQLSTANGTDTAQVVYGPFQAPTTNPASATLTTITSASGGGHFVEYSVDAGGSFTTIRTGGSWSQTTDTVSLPANLYLGLVRVRARMTAAAAGTLNFYETFIQ